jgi:hypothetical protein
MGQFSFKELGHSQSQFYISLEASGELELSKPPNKGSFFDSVKKRIMTSPLKRPSDTTLSNSKNISSNDKSYIIKSFIFRTSIIKFQIPLYIIEVLCHLMFTTFCIMFLLLN